MRGGGGAGETQRSFSAALNLDADISMYTETLFIRSFQSSNSCVLLYCFPLSTNAFDSLSGCIPQRRLVILSQRYWGTIMLEGICGENINFSSRLQEIFTYKNVFHTFQNYSKLFYAIFFLNNKIRTTRHWCVEKFPQQPSSSPLLFL